MWWVHNYPHRGNQGLQRLIFFFFLLQDTQQRQDSNAGPGHRGKAAAAGVRFQACGSREIAAAHPPLPGQGLRGSGTA